MYRLNRLIMQQQLFSLAQQAFQSVVAGSSLNQQEPYDPIQYRPCVDRP